LRLDLRKEFAANWQGFGFLDAGGVRLHKHTWAGWQGGGNTPNSYTLCGAGLGLAYLRPSGWQVRLTLAVPLADNPGRDGSDNNSDGGGQHSPRGWLQINKWF
jgi:hemolysin activation/secretion protein